ncbi:MAG TPA: hypothetical protein VFF72_09440 [Caldimonas sp.]|nr:hypothetical protein [Caldimonas sp.]
MAETDQQRVQKVLDTQVKPLAARGAGEMHAALGKLRSSIHKVEHGIKQRVDAEMLSTYRRELTIDMRGVVDAAVTLRKALNALADATKDDEDFAADEAGIEKMKSGILAVLDGSKVDLRKAKELEDRAAEQIDKVGSSEVEAKKMWAGVVAVWEKNDHVVAKALKDLRQWKKDAGEAVAARDASRLKQLQANPPAIPPDEKLLKGTLNNDMMVRFTHDFHLDGFSRAFRDEVLADAARMKQADKDGQKSGQEWKDILATVAKLSIVPRDAKKAAAVLGLPAGASAKLQPVLELDAGAMPKALESLGKQFKVDLDGKDALAKLRKNGVL